MQVARDTKGGHALVALSVDSAIPPGARGDRRGHRRGMWLSSRMPLRSQAVPTPVPVPNSASVPDARRGQRRQQPAGLVAAERHVAAAARDVEGAPDDVG
jgi:hypothetical protein